MSLIRLKPAIYFITSFLLFLLGLHGNVFFMWLHAIISSAEVTVFGTTCNLIFASFIIYIQWKIR